MSNPIVFVIKTSSEKFGEAMELVDLIKQRHPNAEVSVEVAL